MTSPMMTRALVALMTVWVLWGAVGLVAPTQAGAEEMVRVRRFALIIGANDGGPDRVQLQYAGSDARTMARVLEELGGVPAPQRVLVLDPDINALKAAFGQMNQRLRAAHAEAGVRLELLIYYSGHSDEQGLLLGGQRLDYKALRALIDTLEADVRIAILDSCASGAMTRIKGGQRLPPFLIDQASEVKGHAFLTSAAADEVAQESDHLGASFFTHALVSGLRGGADLSGDGRVTLNEAYQFAFHETLARTENTRSGAQHPAYDIQLSGTGDLVLTDLRGTSARLVIEEGVSGRLYLRDARGALVVELFKQPGRAVELGLEPGEYSVTVKDKAGLSQARVVLSEGHLATLEAAALEPFEGEATVSRGGAGDDAVADDLDAPVGPYRHVPFSVQIVPGLGYPLLAMEHNERIVTHVGLTLGLGMTDRLQGIQFGPGVNWVIEDARGTQLTAGLNLVEGSLRGVQLSAGANFVMQDMRGSQIAAGFNYAETAMNGIQVAAGANLAMATARGFQIAGGLNLAPEGIVGGQIGIVNIGHDVDGLQIGVVNIAHNVRGSQIGVVNVSNDVTGLPFGLVNVVREGQLHFDAWSSTDLPAQSGIRFGSKHFYTMLTGGVRPPEEADGELIWFAGLGLGGHIPLDPLFMDIDVIGGQLRVGDATDHTNTFFRLRTALGWQIADHLALYGGLSLNMLIADQFDRERLPFGPNLADKNRSSSGLIFSDSDAERSGTTLSLWPGAFVGIQF